MINKLKKIIVSIVLAATLLTLFPTQALALNFGVGDGAGTPTSMISGYADGSIFRWETSFLGDLKYFTDEGKQLTFNDSVAGQLLARGKPESEVLPIAKSVHEELYDYLDRAEKAFDKDVLDSKGVADTIFDQVGDFEFDGSQGKFNSAKQFLQAQNAMFLKMLDIKEKYDLTGLPGGLTQAYIEKVLASNNGLINAMDSGVATKDADIHLKDDSESYEIDGSDWVDPTTTASLPEAAFKYTNADSKYRQIYCHKSGLTFDLTGCAAILTYNVVLKGSAWLLGITGMIFNVSLNFTLNIGELFLPDSGYGFGGGSGAVYKGWQTIRDFINITFIFVLLFVSIATILQWDKYGAKKLVIKIVIAAMLINFSLFFTKAIIDLSNIIALQFYARILNAASEAGGNTKANDGGLSSAISNSLGMQTIWTNNGVASNPAQTSKTAQGTEVASDISANQFAGNLGVGPFKLLMISLFGGMFMLVLSMVFFVAVIQFLARTIVLLFIMVTSPLGFIGEAIPGFGGVASDWRKRLTNNAVFAPAYMAILYVVCQMIFGSARNAVVSGGGFRDAIISDTPANSVSIIFWFILVTGLLLTGQAAARGFADKFGSGFTKKAEGWFKGGFGARKFGSKYGRKGLGLAGQGLKAGAGAAAGGLGTAAAFGTRRLFTRTGAGGLLLNTPLRNLGGKKLYDRMAARDVERAKAKAKNLRARAGESKEDFERRRDTMVSNAQMGQAIGLGFDANDFEIDPTTGKIKGFKDSAKGKIDNMEMENKRKWFGRKQAQQKLDDFKKSFGTTSLKDKENEAKELKAKLDAHNAASPSPATAFDATPFNAEIARIEAQNRALTSNASFRRNLARGDAAALSLQRQAERELKEARDALTKAMAGHTDHQQRAVFEHAATADKMAAELKKLARSIKEQEERERKEEDKKDKKK